MSMLDDFTRINPWTQDTYGDWGNRDDFLAPELLDIFYDKYECYGEVMSAVAPGGDEDEPDGGPYRHRARMLKWAISDVAWDYVPMMWMDDVEFR